MHRSISLLLPALMLAVPALAAVPELSSGADHQQTLAVTVYRHDLALVRDTRKLQVPPGVSRLAFADVSAQLRPETAQLYGGPTVLEQDFDYDLLSPPKLLEKYVGRSVGVVRVNPATGEETVEQGTLLSVADGGMVFRFGSRIEASTEVPRRLVFEDIPAGLRERPTLTLLVDNPDRPGDSVELVYLTGGLSWKADYVATLAEGGDTLDLTGWVTITNHSGASYREARLQLMAGDVRRLPEAPPEPRLEQAMRAISPASVPQEGLFEYHLYTLPRPTTLADRQAKQVPLLQAGRVPVARNYRIDASAPYFMASMDKQDLRAEILLRLQNEPPALGQPLPAGVMRFYERDGSDALQFIGEDRIDHTPQGRELKLGIGSAFDITATRRQTDFRKGVGDERESAWEIEVFNAKAEPVSVQVAARFPGEWRILQESLPHEREAADTALWTLQVPAKGRTSLTYRVLLR